MKYKFRAYLTRISRPGPKTKSFVDRETLVRWCAELDKKPYKIYSAEAHGYLPIGDSLDGMRREIELTKQVITLEKKLRPN